MPNFVVSDPVEEFETLLLASLPELKPRVAQARLERHPPSSVYWYLGFVLRPYTRELLDTGDQPHLRRTWAFWEFLAARGSESERDELWSAIEEFDLPAIQPWLGPHLQALIAERTCGAA